MWKCIDSERRVRIKHCAKLTKRVLFERGSGVLFIVGVHRIRISIWICKGSTVSTFIVSICAWLQMLSDFMIKCGKWKMWKSWCSIKIGQSWPSLILSIKPHQGLLCLYNFYEVKVNMIFTPHKGKLIFL